MDNVGKGLVSKLEMTQLERLQEIGLYLERVRQEQGLPLEEIASHTYIPLRILRAIEAGDDHVLPEPIFIQGFIRRYADALGLDGQAIAQEFPLYAQPLQSECIDDDPLVNQPAPWQFPSLKFLKSLPVDPTKPKLNWPLIGAAAAGVVVLGGILYGLSRGAHQSNAPQSASQPESVATPESRTAAPVSEPEASSPGGESDAVDDAPVPLFAESTGRAIAVPGVGVVEALSKITTAPVQVSIMLNRRSWMQVTVDGESEFEGIMDEGTEQTWLGEEEITVLAGDAGAVMLSANGSESTVMGEDGSIAEVTVTPEDESNRP